MASNQSAITGCGCLVFLAVAVGFGIHSCSSGVEQPQSTAAEQPAPAGPQPQSQSASDSPAEESGTTEQDDAAKERNDLLNPHIQAVEDFRAEAADGNTGNVDTDILRAEPGDRMRVLKVFMAQSFFDLPDEQQVEVASRCYARWRRCLRAHGIKVTESYTDSDLDAEVDFYDIAHQDRPRVLPSIGTDEP